jgi:DNA replication and repair protein RecF
VQFERLNLSGYRNYSHTEYFFRSVTTVLLGKNAIGKTNVLEAIYLLSSGGSFRAQRIEEMVNWEAEIAHVTGYVNNQETRYKLQTISNDPDSSKGEVVELGVRLTRGVYQGKRVQKRKYLVNGVARRKMDFVSQLRAVVFRPEDVAIVTGSPGRRRDFLDGVLLQASREYRRAWESYDKGLKRRNKLLDLIQEHKVERRALAFWDQLLIKEGTIITTQRRDLVEYINQQGDFPVELAIVYDPSIISEERLWQYQMEEVAVGHTLVGPHRDDFAIVTRGQLPETRKSRDLAIYGSRGEQRMGVLWLKLMELRFIETQTSERPVLLLDDIFSELDDEHDRMVMDLLGKQQTIITTTELDERFNKDEVAIVRLEDF